MVKMNITIKKTMDSVKNNKAMVVSWLWLIAGYIVDIAYTYGPGKYMINSDMAAEMMMADIANKEHSFIANNWYYANEIRTFSIQWFYRFWLLVFPQNWHMVRTFSIATMLLVLIFASLYFYKQIGAFRVGVWATGFLIWPFGMWHFYYMVRNSYYVCFYIAAFISVAAIIQFAKDKKKSNYIVIALSVIYAFLNGLNGIRELMLVYVPVVLGTLVFAVLPILGINSCTVKEYLAENHMRFRACIGAIFAFVGNAVGYFVYQFVLVHKYYVASEFDGLSWGNAYNAFDNLIQDYLSLFGFQYSTKLFSLVGLLGAFGILTAIILIISIIRLAKNYKKLAIWEQYVYIMYVISMVVQILVYMFLGGYALPYWLPMIPLSIAVIALEIKTEKFRISNARIVVAAIVGTGLTITSLCCIKSGIGSQLSPVYAGNEGMVNIVEWLEENDYNKGVATIWYADAVTELTNGKVEMWAVINIKDTNANPWLQPKSHVTIPESDYFLLSLVGNDIGADAIPCRANAQIVYSDDVYVVYYVE